MPDQTAQYESYRPLLFSIAYRMLGSVMEAEDMVQETYLRFRAASAGDIHSPRTYLCTIVTRLCLDALKSARARRETYVGPWLPEPLPTPDQAEAQDPGARLDMDESISMAFLVLLESLSPLERAVFLLREVFDFDYADIARITGRREDACRQVFHRARAALAARRPRYETTPADRERLLRAFLSAAFTGDLEGLTGLLAEDVTLWSDGGGKVAAALKPIHGSDSVGRFIAGVLRKAPPGMAIAPAVMNGSTALYVTVDGQPFGVALFEMDAERIHELRFVVNPDKLRHLAKG
jgi:RNA polymerase sigma-70 factor (ECF subfamily)